jgi:pimeloyl-ACP methyl ester carboxylesterase
VQPNYHFYRSNRVYYTTCGKGEPLFLVHGYQADSRIWDKVIPFLKDRYQLFIPDLPGHGKTPLIQSTNTMNFLADILFTIILSKGFKGISIAGHSMGGYVALAFAEKYPNMVDKLFLINSHPFEDTMTVLLNRNREAELIAEGRKEMLLRNFVSNSFSKPNSHKLKEEIAFATAMSLRQDEKGMLADIAGMMVRTDTTKVLKKGKFYSDIILGADDTKISIENFKSFLEHKVNIHIIENCGHIGVLEKPEEVAKIIVN